MLLGEGLPFIKDYVQSINEAIKSNEPRAQLTRIQSCWLSFVILGLLVTNSLCWKRFERFSLGGYGMAALSWMFRNSKIFWESLLQASILHIASKYNIKEGVLAIDDTDKERSKNTTKIGKAHKIKDKKRGGYFMGQNIIFLILVNESITMPVGFYFYQPDPARVAWRKEEGRLKAKGVLKKYRPKSPDKNPDYPTKKELALKLLTNFVSIFKQLEIKAVVADAFYSSADFIAKAAKITHQKQIITQIKKNQLINVNGQDIAVGAFFKNYQGRTEKIKLRYQEKTITYRSAKFKVKSHGKKYYIIALKYEGEENYRYLIANDMSWRDIDVIKAFSFRWLIEVFIQDWKQYEGWNQLAKQQDMLGSDRGVILSLLCDHALLLRTEQQASYKNRQPAITVGSLREKVMMESLCAFIEGIVRSDDPKALFLKYADKICELFELRSSQKHMREVNMKNLQSA